MTAMKQTYQHPYIEVSSIEMELLLTATSKKDRYDIGSGDSKWPKSGDVHDDTGNGPGVSGAKEHQSYDFWED